MGLTKKMKVLLTDLAGGVLIVASILLGWLPGPGGIPLFLAGLGLLSINHDWAKRWLERFKNEGTKLAERIFTDNASLKLFYDLLGLTLAAFSVWLLTLHRRGLLIGLGISAGFLGISLLLGNRKRWHRLKARLKR